MKEKNEVRVETLKSKNLLNRLKDEERDDWLDVNDSPRKSPRRFFAQSSEQSEGPQLASPVTSLLN